MKISLNELTQVHGFVGVFLFQAGKGIVAREMPEDYLNSDLVEMAETAQQVCFISLPVFGGIKGLTYCFREFSLVVRELSPQLFMFILTLSDTDQQQLAAPLDRLFTDLRNRISKKA